MKVALLTVNAGAGGVVNVVWQLARLLSSRGIEVRVASDSGSDIPRLAAWGVPHVHVPFNRGLRELLPARRALRELLRTWRPDVVHSHSRWPSMVSFVAGRAPDVSTLHLDRLTSHGSIFDRGRARRLLSVWGRHVTTLDDATRSMLIHEFALEPERVHVVPNGIDPSVYTPASAAEREAARAELGLEAGDSVALFVGQLIDWKRPDWAVRALSRTLARGSSNARLVICGDGPFRAQLTALSDELGVAAACRFLGRRAPIPAYHAADFAVLPSSQEGFPLVCVEAMLCGLPVLRTRAGGCDLQIVEGKTGWAVDIGDEASFHERFAAAIADRDATRRTGEYARKYAAENFNETKFLESTLDVYAASQRP